MNEEYKKEFEEALNMVGVASENFSNVLGGFANKIATSDDLNAYIKCAEELQKQNENFKEAILKYYGFRPDKTGFEN